MPPSRRRVLRALSGGVAGVLAGCAEGAPSATPTVTAAPVPSSATRASPPESPAGSSGTGVRWQYTTDATPGTTTPSDTTPCINCVGVQSRPHVEDASVFVVADAVYALDRRHGTERWVNDVGAPATGRLHREGDTIYSVHGRHTGFVCRNCTIVATHAVSGEERWTYVTPTEGILGFTFLASSTDRLVASLSDDDQLGDGGSYTFGLGTADGGRRWIVDTSDAFDAFLDGLLYVESVRETLWAIDPADGATRWTLDARAQGMDHLDYVPRRLDGLLVHTLYDTDEEVGALHGVEAATGERVWSASPEGIPLFGVRAHPSDALVYAEPPNFLGEAVYAVDPTSGSIVWSYRPATSAVTSTEEVLLVQSGGELHAVDALDGTRRWAVDLELAEGFGVRLAGDVVLAWQPDVATIEAHALADGRRRWGRTLDGVDYLDDVRFGDGVVFAEATLGQDPDRDGVVALGLATGEERWRFDPGTRLTGMAIYDDDAFVGSADGRVFALDG